MSQEQQLNQLKNELQMIGEKLVEMEMESEEHSVVIRALEPLDQERKCHRLIGGVLVERKVSEVLPALRHNQSGISEAIEGLKAAAKAKEADIVRLQKESVVPV